MKKVVSSSSDFSAIRDRAQSNKRLDPEVLSEKLNEENPSVEEEKVSVPLELKGLEDLVFLGAATKKLDIGNFSFTLKTLTSGEQERIFKEALYFREAERVLFFKKASVAMSILKINEKPLSLYLKEDSFDERLKIVDSLQSSVFEMIFESLNTLINESKDLLKVENLKK